MVRLPGRLLSNCSKVAHPKNKKQNVLTYNLYRYSSSTTKTHVKKISIEDLETLQETEKLPNEAKVVICGGGLQGAALAYKLATSGLAKDCVVIDKGVFGSGTTWNSSGVISLVNRSRIESHITQLSLNLYRHLEEELGYNIGAKWNCGSVFVAQTQERLNFYKRLGSDCISRGIECSMLNTPDEIAHFFPYAKVDDLKGGLHVPGDCVASSRDICNALLIEAKRRGVRLISDCDVSEVVLKNGRVEGIDTNHGHIKCEHFVNAAGNWARSIGTRSKPRTHIPCHPVEHYVLHTRPKDQPRSANVPTASDNADCLTVLRDHDSHIWIRSELSGRFVCGGLHPRAKPVDTQQIDSHRAMRRQQLLKDSNHRQSSDSSDLNNNVLGSSFAIDWDHFYYLLEGVIKRVPSIEHAEYDVLVNNPEPFTPDGQWLVGRVANVDNYYVCAGFRSVGLSAAGGIADIISSFILHNKPPFDIHNIDAQRFIPLHNNRKFLYDRVREVPGYIYSIPYPFMEYKMGRALRTGSIFTKLKDLGARFNQVMGYERPMYFNKRQTLDDLAGELNMMGLSSSSGGSSPSSSALSPSSMDSGPSSASPSSSSSGMFNFNVATSNTFFKPSWFNCVYEEFLASRTAVSLCDFSSFAKIEVSSVDSSSKKNSVVDFLQMICSQDIDIDIGGITHTGMQNENGGYENDCTVARLAPNRYLLSSPSYQQMRCYSWLMRHLRASDFRVANSVQIEDTTQMFTTLCLMGPYAQQVLSKLTSASLSLESFPFFRCQYLDVGCAPDILTMNLTHVGELGYVLYIPNEFALHVFECIEKAGEEFGLRHCGYYAMRALRIEKFYAFVGQDLDSTTTPLECGRAFRVKLDSDINFIGRKALEKQVADNSVHQMLAMLIIDPTHHNYDKHPWPWGGETVFRDGKCAGHVTTTSYSFSLNKHVALCFIKDAESVVDSAYVKSGSYEIEIAGVRYPAKARLNAPYLPVPHIRGGGQGDKASTIDGQKKKAPKSGGYVATKY